MGITSTGLNAATNPETVASTNVQDKTKLGKDDFMTLLLVQLQHQDPTEPMDSGAILTQTSELAALEASSNTNTALEELSASLQSSQDFGITSAIGKRADLGSDAISHDEGTTSSFEMYFSEDVASGTIEISDFEGNIVSTMNIQDQEDVNGNVLSQRDAGVYQFDWDGLGLDGAAVESGIYRVNAKYVNAAGDSQTSRIGAYPIESVRFENGETFVKVGSSYVPLADIVEIY
ncbi:MAG: flagellar hook capping FlgD N-terminal domain-containing protein [Sulfurimonas sp.]|nr:flagellar hook capping FlgD N-terminal domain-containing protein [Sulfurimonas sp.]MDQ7060612.1 flagellar hook capping FlgD N-terminal domain-containing protein [Sulfurimonas sp.]